ncbi:hypothetical protein ACIQWN_00795 [Streptomyces vinaceus]|uniref:hypothetical protein n=1 Tax=Streptomyces vinaceus TaxID=1960 RepID=UPI00381E7A8A
MSGCRLHDAAALLTALVAPFLVALALVPFRTDLSSLQGTARLAEDGRSPEAVVEYVRRELLGLPELRVVGGGHYYGRFLLDPLPGPLPPEQDRLVAVALAAQAGSALDSAGLAHLG